MLGDYMGFAGDEAGAPYHYANGGIWPQGNTWYALSLIANGLNDDTYKFIQTTMTLWAGGWYLYTIYNLFGLRENEWNISFKPFIPKSLNEIKLHLLINSKDVDVQIRGKGKDITLVKYNSKILPTLVIPDDINDLKNIDIELGKAKTPLIYSVNGILTTTNFNNNKNILEFNLESFAGHEVQIEIISPVKAAKIFINNEKTDGG
jgi:hypothetical protein